MDTAPLDREVAHLAEIADTAPEHLLAQMTGETEPESPLALALRAGWASADLARARA